MSPREAGAPAARLPLVEGPLPRRPPAQEELAEGEVCRQGD